MSTGNSWAHGRGCRATPAKYKVYDTPFFVFIRAVQLEMEIEPSPNGTIARYLNDRGTDTVNRNY